MKLSRTLQLAVGSAAIVWIVVTYYLQAPPWAALVGALGAILWIASKARRERLRLMHQHSTRDKGRSGEL